MTLKLKPFELNHLQSFGARDDVVIDVANECKDMVDDDQKVMFSVIDEKQSVLIICLQFIKENVGEITVYPSESFVGGAGFLKEFFEKSHSFLWSIMDGFKLDRLQASIDTTEPKFIKWIEGFGFKREGTMSNYGGVGKDYYLYGYGGRQW